MKFADHMYLEGKRYMEHVLKEEDGNMTATARRLGINRTHFYKMLRVYGVDSSCGAERRKKIHATFRGKSGNQTWQNLSDR